MSIFAVVLRSLRGKPSKLPLVSINMMTSLGQPMPALYQGLFLTSNVIWSLAARGHWFKIVLHRKALPQSAKIWALWGSFRYDPVPFLTSLGFTKLYNLSVMVLHVPWPFPTGHEFIKLYNLSVMVQDPGPFLTWHEFTSHPSWSNTNLKVQRSSMHDWLIRAVIDLYILSNQG